MLEFVGAAKCFGSVPALDRCTFAARPGRLTGFLGPNGAGKTTAMRAVFGLVELDAGGFVCTGMVPDSPYATSLPGVFAVGDVRAGSVKRVASSVGEGSVVVHAIHRFLAG